MICGLVPNAQLLRGKAIIERSLKKVLNSIISSNSTTTAVVVVLAHQRQRLRLPAPLLPPRREPRKNTMTGGPPALVSPFNTPAPTPRVEVPTAPSSRVDRQPEASTTAAISTAIEITSFIGSGSIASSAAI